MCEVSQTDLKQEISARMKLAREHLKMSVKEFATVLGTDPQTVRDYENGKSIPGGDKVSRLVPLGIDSNWLLAGPGFDSVPFDDFVGLAKKYRNVSRSLSVNQESLVYQVESDTDQSDAYLYIDKYVNVKGAAGAGQEVFEEVKVQVRIDARLLRERVGNNFSSIKIASVSGDSMEPTMSHGDQVLIDTSVNNFIDDAIYAIQQDGHLRFKRIQKRLDGSIIVKSDNPVVGPETYTAEEAQYFKVIGVVIPFKFGRFKI